MRGPVTDRVTLRDLRLADQQVVRALVLDGLRDRWGDAYDPTANPDLDDIWATYVARGAEVVVAEHDGALVGTGTLRPEPDGSGRILRMSVASSLRRRGVARAIVEELVGRAARRGLEPVVVLTDTPWTSAVELYRSCGFTEVGRSDGDTHFVRMVGAEGR